KDPGAGAGRQQIVASGELLNGPVGLAFAPIPEPSTLLLFSVGAFGLAGWAWRRLGETHCNGSWEVVTSSPAIAAETPEGARRGRIRLSAWSLETAHVTPPAPQPARPSFRSGPSAPDISAPRCECAGLGASRGALSADSHYGHQHR